ncbi:hypothetical protein [Pontibacter vulgaris]|uniref:hypothetical protein n=1 Tax=Pontibacter vulgaris TaxID=2905679 RepID=UPI001FA73BE8|nr:hypothetical protein [Pontibacter vulgaris]
MKILVLLSASLFGFGVAMQNTANETKKSVTNTAAVMPAIEQPVMNVLLDTVEITAAAPVAHAASSANEGVLLDTVEIVVSAPQAIAANLH